MMRRLTVIWALILILALLNFTIFKREVHLSKGEVLFLELAPVDPRSLMQGDYMALSFDIAQKIYRTLPKELEYRRFWQKDVKGDDGLVVVSLDEKKIASFVGIYEQQSLEKDQRLLQYRIRGGEVKFATNAFFFEEGTGETYEKARFGEFRVNEKHELLLVEMYDKNLIKIVHEKSP